MKRNLIIAILCLAFGSCQKNIESIDRQKDESYKTESNKYYYYYGGDLKQLSDAESFFKKQGNAVSDNTTGYLSFRTNNGPTNIAKSYKSTQGNFFSTVFKEIYFTNDKGLSVPLKIDKFKKFVFDDISLDNIFGRTITLSSVNPSGLNSRGEGWTDGMYVPLPLNLSYVANNNTATKSNGFTLNWVKDVKNDKGVFINIEYEPSTEMNPTQEQRRNIIKIISVADNGSYTLTKDDLKEFPTPLQHLAFSVYRGNYKISQFDGKDVPIYIYDKVGFDIRLEN
jgi:hypothetical protein